MHRALCVPALSLLLFATSVAVQQPAITRPDGGNLTPAQIDSRVNGLIQAAHVTGAGVALFHRGKVVYLKASGFRDAEKNLLLTPDSVMTVASLTKSAFATVVMRLVQSLVLVPICPSIRRRSLAPCFLYSSEPAMMNASQIRAT